MLTAGFSKVCISPQVGAPLAGFAAREGVSEGIHDDLYARAVVLVNKEAAIALVSVDLLALSSDFIKRVRQNIQQASVFRPEAVMIASTHTHAGPVTITTFFNPGESLDSSYMDSLAQSIEKAVATAWSNRFTAKVGVGLGHVDRRWGQSSQSRPASGGRRGRVLLRLTTQPDATRGVVINYSCHPTVLGPNNLLVTGDFPNFAIEQIEKSIGPDGIAMFVNGTQGNISMGHSSELSAIGVITPGRTFERAAELGHLLADAALAELPLVVTDGSRSIASISHAGQSSPQKVSFYRRNNENLKRC